MIAHEKKYLPLISAYVDEELQEGGRIAFEEHLRSCHECQDAIGEFRRLRQIGSSTPQYSGNPYYLTRLKAALAEGPEINGDAVAIEAKLLLPMLGLSLIALLLLFSLLGSERAIYAEDYLYVTNRQTLAEQQLLLRPAPFSKDEVLLLTVSNQRGEEPNGR